MRFTKPEDEYFEEMKDELGEDGVVGGKLPAVLTREEVETLYKVAEEGRDKLIIRLFYSTGMRLSELANLRFCDIFYSERTIFIRSGKGGKDRYVTADEKTFQMLKEWQGEKPPSAEVIDIEERQIQRIIDKYGRQTGIAQKYEAMGRSFSPHCFRHSFATHCYENGMDVYTLKKLLGHEFLQTTELYIETGMENSKKEYDSSHEWAKK